MGQLTQTTAQVQVILDDADAANVGKTSLTDSTDTTAVAVRKSGFYSLGASSSNAPSTDRAILISAVRDTTATGEIRYGQVAITESNGMWWNRDDGGTLGTWYEAVSTAGTQTLTNKTLTSPVLTTPQINDTSADHQYVFAVSELAADRTVTLPLLTGNDTFVFEAHTQTLTNKTLTSPVFNTGVSGTAVLDDDTFATASSTTLATSESIKAYVDTKVTGEDLDFAGDTGTGAVDLDSQVFTIAGTANEIETAASSQTLTIGLPDSVTITTALSVDTINEKTAAAGVTVDSLLIKDGGITAGGTSTFAGQTISDLGTVTTANIDGGSIDGTTIGASTAAAITGTTGQFDTSLNVDGTVTADGLTVDGDIRANSNSGKFTHVNDTAGWTSTMKAGDASLYLQSGVGSPIDRMKLSNNGDISFYDTSSNQKLFWDASAASLGIGTTSPSGPLHVAGSGSTVPIKIDNTGTGGNTWRIWSTNDAASDGGGKLGFYNEDTATRAMTLDSSGNVTVGATTANDNDAVTLRQDGTAHVNNVRLADAAGSVGGITPSIYSPASGTLAFSTNIAERMRIDSSGNVGIGTDSPSHPLQVRRAGGAGSLGINIDNVGSTDRAVQYFSIQDNAASTGAGHAFYYRPQGSTTDTFGFILDESGNVGIGTDSPSYLLDVQNNTDSSSPTLALRNSSTGSSAASRLYMEADGNNFSIFVKGDGTGQANATQFRSTAGGSYFTFEPGASEAMRIDGDTGNVGIGTDSPAGLLHISGGIASTTLEGTTRADLFLVDSGAGTDVKRKTVRSLDGSLIFGTENDARNAFTEAMRIDSSGNLLVGATSPNTTANLYTEGSSGNAFGFAADKDASSAGAAAFSRPDDGLVINFYRAWAGGGVGSISVTSTATAYNTSSDQRLKDNIVDAPSASDDIDAIQVRSFDWKADGSHQKYGMIAQELQTVAPEAVQAPEDPDEMMGVDFSKLVPMLVKEIQQLRARVAQLEGAN